MKREYTIGQAASVVREQTGVVIPVYVPPGIEHGEAEALLRDTVAACCAQTEDPSAVCLSVDGAEYGGAVAEQVARETGATVALSERNGGKLRAAGEGVRLLLERKTFRYVAVLDQDGDHFPNELVNFVRAAEHVRAHTGAERLLVLGQRSSRHRPMGFFRGELEELADRILLDALQYRAALTGRPLRLEYALPLAEFPDFHSGYKLFTATTAADVFLTEHDLLGVSDDAYFRHGCEAVMVVKALEQGGYLAVVNRSTFYEQPISTFGLFERCQLVADKIVWPCKCLDVPPEFVRQWLDNHIPRLLLATLVPHGRDEIDAIAMSVMAGMDPPGPDKGSELRPLFV